MHLPRRLVGLAQGLVGTEPGGLRLTALFFGVRLFFLTFPDTESEAFDHEIESLAQSPYFIAAADGYGGVKIALGRVFGEFRRLFQRGGDGTVRKQQACRHGNENNADADRDIDGICPDSLPRGFYFRAAALIETAGELIQRLHDFRGGVLIGRAEHQQSRFFAVGRALYGIVARCVLELALHGVHGLRFQNDQRIGKLIRPGHQRQLFVGHAIVPEQVDQLSFPAGGDQRVGRTGLYPGARIHDVIVCVDRFPVACHGIQPHIGGEVFGAFADFLAQHETDQTLLLNILQGIDI